jgi:hypothetical protein
MKALLVFDSPEMGRDMSFIPLMAEVHYTPEHVSTEVPQLTRHFHAGTLLLLVMRT